MKRTIISTISVVVLSTVLSGCMDKLEILPNDQIITENFFEEGSPEEIESGVNSMYQRLQSSYMYNLRMQPLSSHVLCRSYFHKQPVTSMPHQKNHQ